MHIGIVIGRFQVPYLHAGHLHLLTTAQMHSNALLVLVGVAPEVFTPKNPLPYELRRAMVQSSFIAHVQPLYDCPGDDVAWSRQIDDIVAAKMASLRQLRPNTDIMASLFHGRDSFAPHYKGRHSLVGVAEIPRVSGTELRSQVRAPERHLKEFCEGVIFAVQGKS